LCTFQFDFGTSLLAKLYICSIKLTRALSGRPSVPWAGSPSAGFTAGEPWLPLGEDRATRNVEALTGDPHSILHLHRALLSLRRSRPSLALGDISNVAAADGVLSYERRYGEERTRIHLNLSSLPQPFEASGDVLLSTSMGVRPSNRLAPGEGVILGGGG
jgi:alpha-glucosidase